MHMGFRMSFALSHASELPHYAAPTIRHLAANHKNRLTASSADGCTFYVWFRFPSKKAWIRLRHYYYQLRYTALPGTYQHDAALTYKERARDQKTSMTNDYLPYWTTSVQVE